MSEFVFIYTGYITSLVGGYFCSEDCVTQFYKSDDEYSVWIRSEYVIYISILPAFVWRLLL